MENIHFTFDLTITQGDDRIVYFTFKDDTDPTPVAVDISGWTFFYTAKKTPDSSADDSTAVNSFGLSIDTFTNGGATGEMNFTLPTAKTSLLLPGTYVHDLQRSEGSNITTLGKGKLVVEPQVTNRIS